MCWNYRNYGGSEGTPDPYSSFKDGEEILKFILDDIYMGEPAKLGCYGRSLGGIFATDLAAKHPEFIDFLLVDRSLGSLDKISESRFKGPLTTSLFNYFSRGWVANSYENFYNFKGFKVVAQDPNDLVIDQFCALNSNVAKFACDNTFRAKELSQSPE